MTLHIYNVLRVHTRNTSKLLSKPVSLETGELRELKVQLQREVALLLNDARTQRGTFNLYLISIFGVS